MSSPFVKEKTLKFINKDFVGFKRDLIKFSQAHHSGVFNDFNETSPGMALLELQATIADNLAFYLDQQFSEIKQDTIRQIENAAAFAESKGYRPHGKTAAIGNQSFIIEVPATFNNGSAIPDDYYSPILRINGKVQDENGGFFETIDDLNFATSSFDYPRFVTGSRFDSTTGIPTHFAIKKDVNIVSGETKIDTFTIGDFETFKQIELTNEDVLEVLSVTDSDGNIWYEVDYLARDLVFSSEANTDSDNDIVPYVLKLLPAPRRFITKRDVSTNKTTLIFGSGDGISFDDELVPNLADLSIPLAGRQTFSSYALDPQNFLKTRTLGLSPYNTILTIQYRVGGGSQSNVPAGSIRTIVDAVLDFSTTNLDTAKRGQVISSLETVNLTKTDGGGPEESIEEIKANSDAFFASQDRCVSREDYITRALSLPSKYGKPYKVFVKKTNGLINNNSIDLHVLSKNSNGYLCQISPSLATNMKTYISRYSILNTGINILHTDIINLSLEFGIVVAPKLNRTEILTKCLVVARDYLKTDSFQISEPIVLSDLSAKIQNVFGVISVYKLQFKNLFCPQQDEDGYSTVRFDVRSNTANGMLYCPQNAIFEIKFPNRDISSVAR